jgi:2-C-methyl-D-erythritol 4-phosphate cytidylyltransferase
MFASAIIVAAGKGTRFGSRIPKPFVMLGGKRIIEYSLKMLKGVKEIRQVIVAVSPDGRVPLEDALKRAKLSNVHIVPGGSRRQDSVRIALKMIDPRAQVVLIHDGVRPFAGKKLIAAVLRAAAASGAAIAAVPVKATVKTVRHSRGGAAEVGKTLERGHLWEAQTPQAFAKELIVKAYCAGGARPVTDDASLVERLGHPVMIVAGDYANIKITTPEDLVIAEALLKRFVSKD